MKSFPFRQGVLMMVLMPALAYGGDWTVGAGEEFTRIQDALHAARAGDRILVGPGVYREGPLLIDQSIELIGIQKPILDGTGGSDVLAIVSDHVTIRGFVIQNAPVSFLQENAGVKLKDAHECVVDSNLFVNDFFAIYLSRSSTCRITHNEIHGRRTRESSTGNGIHLWYSNRCTIADNRIDGHRDGIYFEFVTGSEVVGNHSVNNLRYGLHFMFSDSCRYGRNEFRSNGAGVAVMYSRHVQMIDNRFVENWGPSSYGILLKDISDSRLTGNAFVRNTIGLYAEGSNRLQVEGNDFSENGWAVKVMSSAADNVFTRNNFEGNSFDVSTNSRQNFSRFDSNYWGGYSGYDLDRNGVGDVPFRPVRLFSLIVEQNPPSLILLHGLFIDLLDLVESIFPSLTPETLVDRHPLMTRVE